MTHDTAFAELSTLLGDRFDRTKGERARHGTSETWFSPAPPDAVAWPDSTEEVSRIAAICARHGCPIVPWGAGTSLEGHALATAGGITLDFARMNRVLRVDAGDLRAVVQPGISRETLNRELRATGLTFPVDPG